MEQYDEDEVCVHCGGTGIFISRIAKDDEIEKPCVCQERTDEDDDSADYDDWEAPEIEDEQM